MARRNLSQAGPVCQEVPTAAGAIRCVQKDWLRKVLAATDAQFARRERAPLHLGQARGVDAPHDRVVGTDRDQRRHDPARPSGRGGHPLAEPVRDRTDTQSPVLAAAYDLCHISLPARVEDAVDPLTPLCPRCKAGASRRSLRLRDLGIGAKRLVDHRSKRARDWPSVRSEGIFRRSATHEALENGVAVERDVADQLALVRLVVRPSQFGRLLLRAACDRRRGRLLDIGGSRRRDCCALFAHVQTI